MTLWRNQLVICTFDAGGVQAENTICLEDTAPPPVGEWKAIVDALGPVSTNGIRGAYVDRWYPYSVVPIPGATFSSNDRAQLLFRDSNGNVARFNIIAPRPSIFLPDGVTVDLTNSAVVTLANAIMTACQSAAGLFLTDLISGARIASRYSAEPT